MDLEQHYELLHRQAMDKINSSGFEFDPLIDDASDSRRGLTLLFRPDNLVLGRIQGFLSTVSEVDPDQFFYRNPDIHVTVMPIISCYNGFEFGKVDTEAYKSLIGRCLKQIRSFKVVFRGVFFSPSCIIVKGYPLDSTLGQIRENLRNEFSRVSLEQSLDGRYVLRTAHSTIVRFKSPVRKPERMEELVTVNSDLDFGVSTIRKLSFVYNDWYQRHEKVTLLHDFLLG